MDAQISRQQAHGDARRIGPDRADRWAWSRGGRSRSDGALRGFADRSDAAAPDRRDSTPRRGRGPRRHADPCASRRNDFTVEAAIRVENPSGARANGERHAALGVAAARQERTREVSRPASDRGGVVDRRATSRAIEGLTAVGTPGHRRRVGRHRQHVVPRRARCPRAAGSSSSPSSEARPDAKAGIRRKVTVACPGDADDRAAGQAWEGRVIAYIGPKEVDRLEALGLEGT